MNQQLLNPVDLDYQFRNTMEYIISLSDPVETVPPLTYVRRILIETQEIIEVYMENLHESMEYYEREMGWVSSDDFRKRLQQKLDAVSEQLEKAELRYKLNSEAIVYVDAKILAEEVSNRV